MPEIQKPDDPLPRKKNPFDKFKNLLTKSAAAGKDLAQKAGSPNSRETLGKILKPVVNIFEGLEAKIPAAAKVYYTRYQGRWIVVGLLVFIAFSTVRGITGGKGHDKAKLTDLLMQDKQKEEGPIPVKGFKIGRFNFEDSLNALGTIKGAVEFKLSFEVPGAVSSINYREGERYEEGALLISLKQDDILLRLKRSQAELNKYGAQTQIAAEKVKDHEKLFSMGAITKSALESAKLEMESAQYEAEAARLEVKAAESMLEKSNLYAPSAGMIGELGIEEGETVTPNTLLGTHINVEFVFAEFGIVERDVNKIALGQKARVFIDAFPDKTFDGVIENVAPVVAGTSRTATARVRIENPDRLLLPGMFARIRILLYSKKNTLVVPTDSIQGPQGEQFVYVVNSQKDAKAAAEQAVVMAEDTKAKKKKSKNEPEAPKEKAEDKVVETVEKRAITVGYTRPDYSQVDAGISEGEVVAVSGLERLENGKKVRLLETQEAEV